ncbi:hypothetical protein LTS08_006279 [Lithohypha guttulata]|nr:hypothetical protein LTS08_006279 [Lithohypha guttulata]
MMLRYLKAHASPQPAFSGSPNNTSQSPHHVESALASPRNQSTLKRKRSVEHVNSLQSKHAQTVSATASKSSMAFPDVRAARRNVLQSHTFVKSEDGKTMNLVERNEITSAHQQTLDSDAVKKFKSLKPTATQRKQVRDVYHPDVEQYIVVDTVAVAMVTRLLRYLFSDRAPVKNHAPEVRALKQKYFDTFKEPDGNPYEQMALDQIKHWEPHAWDFVKSGLKDNRLAKFKRSDKR